MSSNKILPLIFMALTLVGCQYPFWNNNEKDDVVVIRIDSPLDERVIKHIEQTMMEKIPRGFTSVQIYSGAESYPSATQLESYFVKNYGITPPVYLTEKESRLYIQFEKYQSDSCYDYALNDFNWYKSTARDIEKYSRSEVCATNKNDSTLKA